MLKTLESLTHHLPLLVGFRLSLMDPKVILSLWSSPKLTLRKWSRGRRRIYLKQNRKLLITTISSWAQRKTSRFFTMSRRFWVRSSLRSRESSSQPKEQNLIWRGSCSNSDLLRSRSRTYLRTIRPRSSLMFTESTNWTNWRGKYLIFRLTRRESWLILMSSRARIWSSLKRTRSSLDRSRTLKKRLLKFKLESREGSRLSQKIRIMIRLYLT